MKKIRFLVVTLLCFLLVFSGVQFAAGSNARKSGTLETKAATLQNVTGVRNPAKKANIKKAEVKLGYSSKTYTGKTFKPSVRVKYKNKTLKKNRDYIVKYKNNKNIGRASVIIKGKGKYTGKITKTFRILPEKTSIRKLTSQNAGFSVSWKKGGKQINGYQIQYSTDPGFKTSAEAKKIKRRSVTAWKAAGLKAKTAYYVRIRSFKTAADGKNYFSEWSESQRVITKAAAKESDAMAEHNAEIALQILREREQGNNSNLLVSPVSLYEDLAMAANGAKGDTLAELETYLGGSLSGINVMVQKYNSDLPASLHIANSIWINEKYGDLNPDFKQTAEIKYGARAESVPYDQNTVNDINSWVKENTKGMIPELLDQLDESEAMHLINAVAFESKWKRKYESYDLEERTFIGENGNSSKCTMMKSKEKEYMTLTDDSGKVIANAFLKPYEDGKTAFMGILPVEGKNVADILGSLDGRSYMEMFGSKSTYTAGNLYAGIPEFKLDDEMELVPILQKAGVKKCFTGDADFSGMLKDWSDLAISDIIQKTHIEVDREGTKAAAVTDIAVKATAIISDKVDLYIILDRPFVYGIVDLETGLPIFMGVQKSV